MHEFHPKLKEALQKALGQPLKNALLASGDTPPWQQVFLYFEDGTQVELYINGHLDVNGQIRGSGHQAIDWQKDLQTEIKSQAQSNRSYCLITKDQTEEVSPGLPGESVRESPASADDDYGVRVVEETLCHLQADDQWLQKCERGFIWWGHRLEQRIWSNPVQEVMIANEKTKVWQVCAETSVFREVEPGSKALSLLSILNAIAGLSAFVWNPVTKRITLCNKVYITAENYPWLSRMFTLAASLQAGEAVAKVQGLTRMSELSPENIKFIPDETPHPTSGWREEPDEMLSVAELIPLFGSDKTTIIQEDLASLPGLENPPWVLANGDARQFTAQFYFQNPQSPVSEQKQKLLKKESKRNSPLQTFLRTLKGQGGNLQDFDDFTRNSTLCEIAYTTHPGLGEGLGCRLQLPVIFDKSQIAHFANEWNQVEFDFQGWTHFLGVWTPGKTAPKFTCFIPSALYRRGMLEIFVRYLFSRSEMVSALCHGILSENA